MAEVSWQVDDPVVENISYTKDAAGFWNVSITLQEATPGSLGKKVVMAKLKAHGKDVAQSLWPVTASRPEGETSKTTLTFQTGSATYPDRARLEIELTEK
jgi:hypothetical protein